VSGIFIVLYKPFRVNDIIEVSNLSGVVEDITLNHTVIRNFENRRIIIPNSVISSATLINSNLTDERICVILFLQVAQDADVELALRILKELAEAHPLSQDYRTPEEMEKGHEKGFAAVSRIEQWTFTLRLAVWVANPSDAFMLRVELNRQIIQAFREHNITLPSETVRHAGPPI
jgi:small-conductance mechanosensitive channel